MSYTDFGIHEIRVGQIHRRPTHPKIRVGLVLHVLHGSGAYGQKSQNDLIALTIHLTWPHLTFLLPHYHASNETEIIQRLGYNGYINW